MKNTANRFSRALESLAWALVGCLCLLVELVLFRTSLRRLAEEINREAK